MLSLKAQQDGTCIIEHKLNQRKKKVDVRTPLPKKEAQPAAGYFSTMVQVKRGVRKSPRGHLKENRPEAPKEEGGANG